MGARLDGLCRLVSVVCYASCVDSAPLMLSFLQIDHHHAGRRLQSREAKS